MKDDFGLPNSPSQMGELTAEAAPWVARFDAGDVSAEDQAAFQAWLKRSRLHREAFAELGNIWVELDQLKGLIPGARDEFDDR
jgi:ferric-dicitrate binding protein FerR (iron transport regulator)